MVKGTFRFDEGSGEVVEVPKPPAPKCPHCGKSVWRGSACPERCILKSKAEERPAALYTGLYL